MKISLVKKINFFTVGFIVIISLVSSIGLYVLIRASLQDMEKGHLKELVEVYSIDVSDYFSHVKTDLTSIAAHREVRDFLSLEEKYFQDEYLLDSFNHHNVDNRYAAVYLMDNEGVTWASTDDSFVGNNYAFRDYFIGARENGFAHHSAVGVTSGELGYYFAKKIEDNEGVFLGVLVIKFDSKFFNDYLSSLFYDKDKNLMLVDKYGVVIYSDEKDKLFKSLAPLDSETKKYIEEKKVYANKKIDSLEYYDIYNFISSNLSSSIFETHDKYDNEQEILAVRRLDMGDYLIILEEDKETLYSFSRDAALRLSLIVILLGLFLSFLIYYVINKIISPLEKLHDAIHRLEKGDLSSRADVKTGDELEDIAEGFNQMAMRLEKNIKNIEDKIAERTKTLEELNKHMVGRELKMLELKRKLNKKINSKKDEN